MPATKSLLGEDLIDSREVAERIAYLEIDEEDNDEGDQEELDALRALAEEAEGYAEDWNYGVTLIRESYFTEYAQDLAEDIGAIDPNASWPMNHIDWEAAADALKEDYTQVDLDGIAYYVR